MFRKVHYRLTFLCAGITTFLLFTMSLTYLYVSEQGLKQNHFLSFQRDIATLIANFERQTLITHTWLSQMESFNAFTISITDNGIPLLFSERAQDEKRKITEQEALEYYRSHYSVTSPDAARKSFHTEYSFTSSYKEDYYACYTYIPYENGKTELLILSPVLPLNRQIHSQRIRFAAIDTAAVCLLFLFSFFFTKKLLIPIENSRLEQTRFVAAASHELRTPLAVILSCTNAIQGHNGKKALPEEEETFLNTIYSEGQRMKRLIDDKLFLSQADSHAFSVHPEPIEPDTLLLNSYEAFEAMAAEKNISFRISLPDSPMPPCLGDRERLQQLIAILLHNAVSYTPENGSILLSLAYGKSRKTDSDVRRCHDSYTIAVADSGIGIPDEEKAKIFRRFYRSDQSRSTKEHFGLGLCIAEEITHSLKGSIHVEDTPGGGSTFLVRLPFKESGHSSAPADHTQSRI